MLCDTLAAVLAARGFVGRKSSQPREQSDMRASGGESVTRRGQWEGPWLGERLVGGGGEDAQPRQLTEEVKCEIIPGRAGTEVTAPAEPTVSGAAGLAGPGI